MVLTLLYNSEEFKFYIVDKSHEMLNTDYGNVISKNPKTD
jgi:hypothetical protein